MKFLWSGVTVLIFSLLTGCHSSAVRKATTVYPSPESWPTFYKNNHRLLQTLQSEAQISLETPSFAANFTVSLVFASPDTLFLKAEGPLGLDLGKIFIGKERFIIFNQFNNQFLAGALDDQFYNTFLETHLTFHQIKYGLLGYTPLPENVEFIDPQNGIFSARQKSDDYRYRVELQSGKLLQMDILQNGQVIFTQEFRNYTVIEGVLIPRLTRMILPLKNEMVAIYQKNIKINHEIDRSRYFIEIGPKIKQLIISN